MTEPTEEDIDTELRALIALAWSLTQRVEQHLRAAARTLADVRLEMHVPTFVSLLADVANSSERLRHDAIETLQDRENNRELSEHLGRDARGEG